MCGCDCETRRALPGAFSGTEVGRTGAEKSLVCKEDSKFSDKHGDDAADESDGGEVDMFELGRAIGEGYCLVWGKMRQLCTFVGVIVVGDEEDDEEPVAVVVDDEEEGGSAATNGEDMRWG